MKEVGFFKKVSYEQFLSDWYKLYGEKQNDELIRKFWEEIKLPERSTSKSAGYDFFLPMSITMFRGDNITIPTGISCVCDEDVVLLIFPRSSLGFKYGLSIANTIPVIDADYSESDNEGHILIKLCYEGRIQSHSSIRLTTEQTTTIDNMVFPEIFMDDSTVPIHKTLQLHQGDKFVQGILTNYYITTNDHTDTKRNGGFGSTGV